MKASPKGHRLLRSGPAPLRVKAAKEAAEDLAAFEARASEPDLPFEEVLKDLRRRGKV